LVTASFSAERFALDALPEAEDPLCGVELELELLDEHAASASAAPAATTPNTTREARGFCLPSLKRFMRPRISDSGLTQTLKLMFWMPRSAM
jgi:hypothetical protein